MDSEAEYRAKAAQIAALIKRETNPGTKLELERLSASYLRLADQARANSRTDVVYETPPQTQTQPIQAQQSRLKTDQDE